MQIILSYASVVVLCQCEHTRPLGTGARKKTYVSVVFVVVVVVARRRPGRVSVWIEEARVCSVIKISDYAARLLNDVDDDGCTSAHRILQCLLTDRMPLIAGIYAGCIFECVNSGKQSYALDSLSLSLSHPYFPSPSNSGHQFGWDGATELCVLENQNIASSLRKMIYGESMARRTLFNHIRLVPSCLLLARVWPDTLQMGTLLLGRHCFGCAWTYSSKSIQYRRLIVWILLGSEIGAWDMTASAHAPTHAYTHREKEERRTSEKNTHTHSTVWLLFVVGEGFDLYGMYISRIKQPSMAHIFNLYNFQMVLATR